jgi:hypothetical protein
VRTRWIVSLLLTLAPCVGSTAAQTAAQSAPAGQWTIPRTPWGHPDLSGIYSNNSESLIPMERPAEFDGRRIEDLSAAELEQINRQRVARFDAAIAGLGSTLFAGSFERPRGRPWLIVDPPDGHIPSLTAEAQARLRQTVRGVSSNSIPDGPFDSYEDLGLYDRCITRGIPDSMLPVGYGSNYEIIQTSDVVAIRYEMIHEVRVVPLDGRPRTSPRLRLDLGDARGRWEGASLVVETINFNGRSTFRGASENLRLIERFTPTAPGIIEWQVTLDDARTWTRPWTFASTLTRMDESQRIFEYACHEGNYSLRNMLSGARRGELIREGK